MRAGEPQVCATDRGHADEVVRAREECREGRGEGIPASCLQADRGREQLLLRDVHLEVPLRVRLPEDLREGGVADLAVERDDVSAGSAKRCERLAVRLPRRDLFADVVARQLEGSAWEGVRLGSVGLRDVDVDVAQSAELGDRPVRIVEGLAVPAGLVLDRLDALALDRPGDHDRRLAGRARGLRVRAVHRLDVVPVDLDRLPAERVRAVAVDVEVPADHRLPALAQAVDVEDRGQVVELVMGGVLESLPHRAFGHFAVAREHPHARGEPVEVLRCERHSDAERQALAE